MRRTTLAAVGLLLTLGGCAGASGSAREAAPALGPSSGPSSGPSPSLAPLPVGDAARAARALGSLRLAARRPPVGFERAAFGGSWRDTDGNGCNQRDDVLLRDAVAGSARLGHQGRCDHDVLAGSWHDPYTGRTLVLTDLKDPRQAQAVQIDHVVPLAEAWASGAATWPGRRRERFANNLGELLAVDGPTNASKGDGDPAAWRPRKAYQCTYAIRWIAIKTRWGLAADPSEVAALRDMLGYCSGARP